MRVKLIQRRAFDGQFSIEGIFSRLAARLEEMGVLAEQVVVPHYSKRLIPRFRNWLFVKNQHADIVHVTGDIHYVVIGSTRRSTVVTVHDCHPLERLTGVRRFLLKLFWYRLPTAHAGAVTVISEETKQQLLIHLPNLDLSKVHVIPDSVSSTFRPKGKTFNSDCPRILQIGTKSNKNVERLIAALHGVRCKLVLVGKLPASIEAALDQFHVDFESLSNLTEAEIVSQYQRCDLVTLVSTYEGFGMPIVEAQFVERPVVTSNCSSMPEVAGNGACLVDPFSVDSIREGIEKVILDADYRDSLIERGRINRERFCEETIAQQYIAVYQSVLDSKSASSLN